MEQTNLPTLWDERQLTTDERAFLDYQDFRMRSVAQLAQMEVGRILKETRDWFHDNHKWGYAECVKKRWGFDRKQAEYLIGIFEDSMDAENFRHLGLAFSAQLALKEAPDQQAAIDEVKIRQELEEKITAKKAQEIAALQRDAQIASDNAKSAGERLFALESQIAYYKQQAVIAQAQAAQQPKTIEKTVEKRVEVTPQHVLDRQRDLEGRLRDLQKQKTELQVQAEQFKKQRDLYKRDLGKERRADNAVFLQNLEPKRDERVRANYAEGMHEIKAWCVASVMKLPSIADTQTFGAEEWKRSEEALQALDHLAREIRKLKDTVSSSTQQPLIIDSAVVDAETWG